MTTATPAMGGVQLPSLPPRKAISLGLTDLEGDATMGDCSCETTEKPYIAHILQQYMCKKAEGLVLLMETAVTKGADLVLVQEPPLFDGNRHPAFDCLRAGRVVTARRKNSTGQSSQRSVTRERQMRRPNPGLGQKKPPRQSAQSGQCLHPKKREKRNTQASREGAAGRDPGGQPEELRCGGRLQHPQSHVEYNPQDPKECGIPREHDKSLTSFKCSTSTTRLDQLDQADTRCRT